MGEFGDGVHIWSTNLKTVHADVGMDPSWIR